MNIKTINSIVIFFLLSITSLAQEFTEEDKQFYLNELNNPVSEWINTALYKVIDNKVIEATPILENNFWSYDRLNQIVALDALYRLGSENTSNYAYRLLDTLDINPTGGQDYSPLPSHSRVEITEILCLMGDFSTVDYVFDFLNSGYREQLDHTINHVLYLIIKNYAPYEERARQELEYNVFQGDNRIGAVMQLEEVYGAEIIPLIIRVFKEDPESSNRMIVLDEYFSKYHNEIDLQGILREQLYADTTSSVRFHIAKVLLYGVGGARNYKFIKEYLPNEADSNVHFLLNNRIVNYRPDQPDTSATMVTMLDTLISYTSQCYKYEWITNKGIYNSLSKKLENAKKDLGKGKEEPAKNKIESFQHEIVAQNGKHITDEGYKFLYHYAEYILDRFPAGESPTIESISPSITIEKAKDFTLMVHGSDFTKKSEVHWNGKKKKTKFISENVLEAKIKDKDIKKEGTYLVTVRENKKEETEGVKFYVYKELPEKLIPVLNCIEELEGKKNLAWFGYENYNDGIVLLDGKENEIKGGKKKDKEVPPVIFMPGIHEKVFSIEYDGKKKLTWELGKEKAEVKKDSPLCQ